MNGHVLADPQVADRRIGEQVWSLLKLVGSLQAENDALRAALAEAAKDRVA